MTVSIAHGAGEGRKEKQNRKNKISNESFSSRVSWTEGTKTDVVLNSLTKAKAKRKHFFTNEKKIIFY
jgi:phenolic acid decarboxylase